MIKKPYSAIIALFCTIVSIMIGIFKEKLSFSLLSDYLFMFTLFFLIIGALLAVFASGFFDFFQYSVRKAITRKEKRELPYMKLSEAGAGSYQLWLKTAGWLLAESLIFLTLAYI